MVTKGESISARICRCEKSPGRSSDRRMRSLSEELYSSKRTQSLYFISSGREESCSLYSLIASERESPSRNFLRVLSEGTKYLQHGMLFPSGVFPVMEINVMSLSFGREGDVFAFRLDTVWPRAWAAYNKRHRYVYEALLSCWQRLHKRNSRFFAKSKGKSHKSRVYSKESEKSR